MELYLKSALNREQLEVREALGVPIELQLFDELEDLSDVYRALELLVNLKVGVQVVHAPINKRDDTNLEWLCNSESYKAVFNTLELAGLLSKHYRRKVTVVLHFGANFELLKTYESWTNKLFELCDYVLLKYPRIDIAVENVLPLTANKYGTRGNYYNNGISLVKWLNSKYNTDRFGTVLDTCHAMGTIDMFKQLGIDNSLELEMFFIENNDVLKLIHLADCLDFGVVPETHGIMFSEHRYYVLEECISLYKQYGNSVSITLEVQESDYTNPCNAKTLRNKCIDLLK